MEFEFSVITAALYLAHTLAIASHCVLFHVAIKLTWVWEGIQCNMYLYTPAIVQMSKFTIGTECNDYDHVH